MESYKIQLFRLNFTLPQSINLIAKHNFECNRLNYFGSVLKSTIGSSSKSIIGSSLVYSICNSCNMGTGDLPDMYAQAKGPPGQNTPHKVYT